MVIFDTDILIWIQRGNKKAAHLVDKMPERNISVLTYMELLQLAPTKAHHKLIKDFLTAYGFRVLPLTENVGHRAAIYIEEYSMSDGLRAGDAIIAATAVENSCELITANKKHFVKIKELQAVYFKP